MAIRFPLAFLLGLAIYMIAMAMTVYDGGLSLIFQPIAGSIMTMMGLLLLSVVGSPLLIGPVWSRWSRVGWLALLISLFGLVALVVAWHPALRSQVFDEESQSMIETFHPSLATGGWLAAMFGVAFCPMIGMHGDRRWF